MAVVAKGKYLKTSPVPLLDLHNIILLRTDKPAGGRVIQHKEISATQVSVRQGRMWAACCPALRRRCILGSSIRMSNSNGKKAAIFYIIETGILKEFSMSR